MVAYYGQFFDGNEGAMFNTVAPRYNSDLGIFELKPVLGADGNWSGLEALADIFKGSNYYMNGEGIAELSGTIDTLTNFLAIANGGSVIDTLKESGDFQAVLQELGIDLNTADDQTLANAAVFYVADKLQGTAENPITTDGLLDAMYDDDLAGYLGFNNPSANDAVFVTTAVQYALLQSYVNSVATNDPTGTGYVVIDENGNEKSLTGTQLKQWFADNPPHNSGEATNLITNLTVKNKDSYEGYLDDAATTDIDVFLGIMDVVDQNTGAFDDISGEGVFSNSDIQDVLNQYLGGK